MTRKNENPIADRSDDKSVRRGLHRGDNEAFRAVVTGEYRAIFQRLRRLTNDSDIAADLTQETFVQAWQSLPSLRQQATIGTWLRTISVRVWWKHVQARRAAMPEQALSDELAETLTDDRAPDVADRVLAAIEWETVACVLQQMPDATRTLIVLHHLEQMSYSEIADALDVPATTVKSRLHAAMCRLRRRLAPLRDSDR